MEHTDWALLLVTGAAGWCDLRNRSIPNALPVLGLAGALLLQDWRPALQGLGLALAVYLPLYALRAVGGGDLKLMLSVGALAGPVRWLLVFVLTAVAGGVAATALALAHGKLGAVLRNVGVILTELLRGRGPYRSDPALDVRHPRALRLPHAAVIAAATWLVVLSRVR